MYVSYLKSIVIIINNPLDKDSLELLLSLSKQLQIYKEFNCSSSLPPVSGSSSPASRARVMSSLDSSSGQRSVSAQMHNASIPGHIV